MSEEPPIQWKSKQQLDEIQQRLDEFRYLMAQRGLGSPVGAYLMRLPHGISGSRSLYFYDFATDSVMIVALWFVTLIASGSGRREAIAASVVMCVFQLLFLSLPLHRIPL